MGTFDARNRCPTCGGDAAFSYHHPNVSCADAPALHMHRRCDDCGFRWTETPPAVTVKEFSDLG